MIKNKILLFFKALDSLLYRPSRVFYISLFFVFMSLMVDGTIWNLWRLNKEISHGESKILQLSKDSKVLAEKIQQTHSKDFIEREARRRFELASKGDLVFVFPPSNK